MGRRVKGKASSLHPDNNTPAQYGVGYAEAAGHGSLGQSVKEVVQS